MRAAFLLENLYEKISFLNHAISPRPSLPSLSGFLIEAQKGKLKFSATDLELGITTSIPASVEEEGKTVVPAKPFSEIITSLTDEKIIIEKKGSTVVISGKKTKASFVVMDEVEFPKLLDEKGENIFVLKKDSVEKDLGRVVFAASQDAGRPAFSGVLIKKDGESVLVVATDSHRLSLNKTTAIKTKTDSFKKPVLISAKTIRAMLSQKSDEDVSVFVLEKNNQVVFSFGETILVGRTIEAEFPDFEKIIPDGSSTKAEFDRQEMLKALKITSVFARDNANIVKISVGKNSLLVSAKSQTLGEDSFEVSAKTTGEDNEIAFNARYLFDLLQNVSEDQMVFEMQGPLNPGVFKIANDPNFVHLIMPIRVKDEELPS